MDKECAADGGWCNQGSCSSLLPHAYTCVTAGDCFSNLCGKELPFSGQVCYIFAGEVCLADSDCALGSCLPYGTGKYWNSVWHSDLVPDYVADKPCVADITHVCVPGECRTGKKYLDVCADSTECADTAIWYAPGDVIRCALPVGSAYAKDELCPAECWLKS